MSKYGFFYPETRERVYQSLDFDTPEAAVEYWQDRRPTWDKLDYRLNPDDHAAFMSSATGHIVVVREIEGES